MIGGIHPMMMTPVGGGLRPQDVFASLLYTGTNANQSLTPGIDVAGKGGLFWAKSRSGTSRHTLWDTARGAQSYLESASANAATNTSGLPGYGVQSFNANGVSLGQNYDGENPSGSSQIGWFFRRAAKFFDVVTYTGNGVAGRQIAHALGVAPGMVIVKRVDNADSWAVYHRTLGSSSALRLELTNAAVSTSAYFGGVDPTTTTFAVGTACNQSGGQYVAYLFAHDPDPSGIVQCGSFTPDGSGNATVNLGWRPQFLLAKRTDNNGVWRVLDTARGWAPGNDNSLLANTSDAEFSQNKGEPFSTGFTYTGEAASSSLSYLAIREPIY